jgi:hypothetical protein
MNSAVYSLAGRYENPIPPQCLAPIDFLKIPALNGRESGMNTACSQAQSTEYRNRIRVQKGIENQI